MWEGHVLKRRIAFSYGCVMVKIPEPLAEEARCYGASIPSAYLVKGNEDAPSGLSNDVHITVKYGLLEDDPEKVAGVIAGTEPILVRLGRASIFHNENEAVLKLGVESPGLKALHHKLAGSLRNVNTYRDYRPHVTIAYMVKKKMIPITTGHFSMTVLRAGSSRSDRYCFRDRMDRSLRSHLEGMSCQWSLKE